MENVLGGGVEGRGVGGKCEAEVKTKIRTSNRSFHWDEGAGSWQDNTSAKE